MLRADPTCAAPSTCSFSPFQGQTLSAVNNDFLIPKLIGTHLECHFSKQGV